MTDPELRGLAASLDVDGFLELLQRRLPECREELVIEQGRISDVQYQPGARGLVLYRLKLRERGTGHSRRQDLAVRALTSRERPKPPAPEAVARYAALRNGTLRTPYVELPEHGLVAYAFPLDPVLGSLLPAFDPNVVRQALRTLWRKRGVCVRRVTPHPLGYTPLARAAIRYEVLSEARDGGVPEVRHLIGKIHAHKPAARLFAGAWALWRAAKLRIRLAPPVGFLGALDMSLQERVEGTRLGDLAEDGSFAKPVRQTARSIALLHGLDVPAASCRSAEKEARGVHRWGSVLAALRPDRAAQVERLRDRLSSRLASAMQVTATVHGDFHPANVLAAGDHVTLIDLDQMARGDPMIDVGRFLASLRVSSLRVSGDPNFLEPTGEKFLEKYLEHRPDDEERARLFESACLLTAAATGFRLQRPGWEKNASLLLDEAVRAFERSTRSAATGRRPPRTHSRSPSVRGSLREDAVYLHAALDPYVREAYGAEVASCRVLPPRRRDPRSLLRYRLSGSCDGAAFRLSLQAIPRPSGGGRRALVRLEAIRQALDGQGDAPRLPRPVACLGELGLLVLEEPPGEPLDALVGKPSGPEVAVRVARALRALHALEVPLDRERPLGSEVAAVCERAKRLEEDGNGLGAAERALAARASDRIRAAAPGRAPVLGRFRPASVSWDGERVAFTDLRHLAWSHPLLDVGELLGRLRILGADRLADDARVVARGFLDSYLDGGTARAQEVAGFETLALVRAACWKAEHSQREAAKRLLVLAEAALESCEIGREGG